LITDSDEFKIGEIIQNIHLETECLQAMLRSLVEDSDPSDSQGLGIRYESSGNTKDGIKVRIIFDIEDESV
jgi:hypothetical protein